MVVLIGFAMPWVFFLRNQKVNCSLILYGACFGLDNLSMTILSMSHDQNVFLAMLGKKIYIQKSLSLKLMDQSLLVLVCPIRDMDLTKYVQKMVLG